MRIDDKVEFEFDPGEIREGKVVRMKQEPGWDVAMVQIRYRGSLSWRFEGEVTVIETLIEMLDDFGNVTEACVATATDDVPCEDGESEAFGDCDGKVFQWVDSRGIISRVCRRHIDDDGFCRFKTS